MKNKVAVYTVNDQSITIPLDEILEYEQEFLEAMEGDIDDWDLQDLAYEYFTSNLQIKIK